MVWLADSMRGLSGSSIQIDLTSGTIAENQKFSIEIWLNHTDNIQMQGTGAEAPPRRQAL